MGRLCETREDRCTRRDVDGYLYEYWADEGGEQKGARVPEPNVRFMPQPKTRGTAYVDHSASSTQTKITIWIDGKDCDIWSDDIVEVRTVRRTTEVTWEDPPSPTSPATPYRFPPLSRSGTGCA
jgi:hypothetical protein